MKYNHRKLKKARIKKRLTMTELSERTKLSIGTISTIEQGRGPWLKALRVLEDVLNVRVIAD